MMALFALLGCGVARPTSAAEPTDPWPELARDIFNGRQLADGAGLVAIEMPYRAEDAAIVPVTLRATLPAGDTRTVKAITLVIDQNPAPVAATFRLGAGVAMISTRVRIDSYTNVHAVAELSDGTHYAAAAYVKASGGCSAPTAKNADQVANIGQMRFRQFAKPTDGPAGGAREAQIMIRHPNNSGLQRDQVSLLYIPAYFVQRAAHLAGRPIADGHRGRDFDLAGSEHPLQLPAERRLELPRRGGGHRGSRVQGRMAGRARRI